MSSSETRQDDREDAESREAARDLIGERGWHGAVDACLRNGWEGVLTVLLRTDAGQPTG